MAQVSRVIAAGPAPNFTRRGPDVAPGPVRYALLLERYAVVHRDSGEPAAAAATLQQAIALLPPDQVTRRRLASSLTQTWVHR